MPLIIQHPLIKMCAKPPKFGKKLTIVFRIKILTFGILSQVCITMSIATIKAPDRLLSRNDRNKASFQSLPVDKRTQRAVRRQRKAPQVNASIAISSLSQLANGKQVE